MGEDLVRQLCKAGYKVIVKLHDRSFQMDYQYSGGVNWAERLENLLIKDGGFLARSSDATPFLAAADVMITDHSSAGFEYLLVDRPLIRIEVPELIVETRIPEEYVSLMAEASVTVRTSEEAVRAVDRCLADPSIKSLSRKAVSEDLFFDPGNATSRAVEELYQILELVPFAGCAQAKETRISL
jgi:CDP-glycerol glycerophosphotransferase (TagB/SpsB family)